MELGNEKWKWIVVFILLGIFIVTAKNAYISVFCQEEYPPPDDYKLGDSWDIEHRSGPGAGQPLEVSNISENSIINNFYISTSNSALEENTIKSSQISINLGSGSNFEISEEEISQISNPASSE